MESLTKVVDSIRETLGEEESGNKYKEDKEVLITANGNLLRQQAMAKEEDSFFEEGKKEKTNEPFDFRTIFDSKGKFKR